MSTFTVKTRERTEMIDITSRVADALADTGVTEGVCFVYVPHTTAGVTINENADPSVTADILMELNKRIPFEDGYRHSEGNSAAHIKASLMGACAPIPVESARLQLGTWQGIYFCEFDGPRTRGVIVTAAAR